MRHEVHGGTRHRARAFSLVELLVALAVAAILLGVAAPSFGPLADRLSRSAEYNALANDLRLARLEAIKRAREVTVCARSDATSCGSDWARGWHIFVEKSAAEGGTMGTIETGETLLRSRSGNDGRFRIGARAIVRPVALADRPHLVFDPRGRADWSLGTVVICDARGAESALALVLNGAGSFRQARTTTSSPDVVVDAFGDPVECPS